VPTRTAVCPLHPAQSNSALITGFLIRNSHKFPPTRAGIAPPRVRASASPAPRSFLPLLLCSGSHALDYPPRHSGPRSERFTSFFSSSRTPPPPFSPLKSAREGQNCSHFLLQGRCFPRDLKARAALHSTPSWYIVVHKLPKVFHFPPPPGSGLHEVSPPPFFPIRDLSLKFHTIRLRPFFLCWNLSASDFFLQTDPVLSFSPLFANQNSSVF